MKGGADARAMAYRAVAAGWSGELPARADGARSRDGE
jgi:hypothetical protein